MFKGGSEKTVCCRLERLAQENASLKGVLGNLQNCIKKELKAEEELLQVQQLVDTLYRDQRILQRQVNEQSQELHELQERAARLTGEIKQLKATHASEEATRQEQQKRVGDEHRKQLLQLKDQIFALTKEKGELQGALQQEKHARETLMSMKRDMGQGESMWKAR